MPAGAGSFAQLVPLDLRRWDLARVRRAILALCEHEMWRVHRPRVLERPDDFSDGLRAFIRYGGKLSEDKETNQAYYGTTLAPSVVFEGQAGTNRTTNVFTAAMLIRDY